MTCAITTLERCWYLSPPWSQQMPSLEVHLSEKVYLTTDHAFGYCCGVLWQNEGWVYAVNCDGCANAKGERSITYVTKHEIIGTGRVQSTYLRKPAFVLGDRVMLRFDSHATKQRLILGILLVNNAWFYVVELMSPVLSRPLAAPVRFPLVSEQDLIRVHV